ncbi:putative reverse transcriptase domain, ribonuclease H domain, ribonuclease H-like superfamily [Arabidopsis thaliana]
MERLCHMINRSILDKKWKPISICRGGPKLSHICFADDLILFAEASVSQIRIIRRVLETFCRASGQKVNLEKSKIYFSSNVSRDLEKLIGDESGIKSTRDLGKYLGVPVLQKRINKDTFAESLERMSSRLSGWKRALFEPCRPCDFNKSCLDIYTAKFDKVSKSFLWGSTVERRKQHLVSWKRVSVPKAEGGLGIRKAQDMNVALVAKLGWRLLQSHDSLWTRVLRKKYKVGDIRDTTWLIKKNTWSPTWRSITAGMREVVLPGMSWVVGDGRKIRFWKDIWLFNKTVSQLTMEDLPAGFDLVLASDLWHDGRGWDFEKISPFIIENTRLELLYVVLEKVTGVRDCMAWGETVDGEFSVRSAHALVTRDLSPRPNVSSLFNRIWGVVATERAKMFLWLVGNQALMTDAERFRRHLCISEVCQVCKGGSETILHMLRDCPAMAGLWDRIIPRQRRRLFFEQSLIEWLYSNLGDDREAYESVWSTVFTMAVWWAWKWRCDNVFDKRGKCRDRTRFIKEAAQEVTLATNKLKGRSGTVSSNDILVGWSVPAEGWLKLNTDGASRGNPGLSTAGGVLRGREGEWLGGFSLNIGRCTAPAAELWGVYYGLYLAWEKKVSRVELEVDSALVVGFLKTGVSERHPLSFLGS